MATQNAISHLHFIHGNLNRIKEEEKKADIVRQKFPMHYYVYIRSHGIICHQEICFIPVQYSTMN